MVNHLDGVVAGHAELAVGHHPLQHLEPIAAASGGGGKADELLAWLGLGLGLGGKG